MTFGNIKYSIYIVALVLGVGSSLHVFRCLIGVTSLLTRRLKRSGYRIAIGVAANCLTVDATNSLRSK